MIPRLSDTGVIGVLDGSGSKFQTLASSAMSAEVAGDDGRDNGRSGEEFRIGDAPGPGLTGIVSLGNVGTTGGAPVF